MQDNSVFQNLSITEFIIMSISQIENFFLEIEELIKLRLQDKILNKTEIEQKFKEGKELIDNLEGDEEEKMDFVSINITQHMPTI